MIQMKKLTVLASFLIMLSIFALSVYSFSANSQPSTTCIGGTGEIRIEPHSSYYPLPVMLSSPATFNISVTAHKAYNPNILLVMTNASYQGLTGPVVVKWPGGSTSFPIASWTAVDSGYIPPSGTTEGARYHVPTLKDHIGVNETDDDTLWYVYGPFLSGPITTTPQEFNVTLPSTAPRMLVYALGKSKCSTLFNMKVPPTRPGFIVPDLAPALLSLASFSAFAVYALRRRKL